MSHDQLPLPDIDSLSPQSLQHRIRSLEAEEVDALLAYELEHGNRLPVLMVLRARLDELASGAEPTDGDPDAVPSDTPSPQPHSSKVSPATAATPDAPSAHGVPLNNPPETRTN